MIDVTQGKLEHAIQQYGSINTVLDNVSLKPFWVEWDVARFYAQVVETLQHRFAADDKVINVSNMCLYPIMVGRRDFRSNHVFAVHAAHEDNEGVYRNIGSICEFWVAVVARRANGDWLKITPQCCMPQALDYLNMLITKLEETLNAWFKHPDAEGVREPRDWAGIQSPKAGGTQKIAGLMRNVMQKYDGSTVKMCHSAN